MRINLQPAFVLHTKPWQETSMLVYLFAKDYGRVNLIAKGVRSNKNKTRGWLMPFLPLLISWSGKGELMVLTKIEAQNLNCDLSEAKLISAFYLNELLLKLFRQHDPHPKIYAIYQETLTSLQKAENIQIPLRLFEKSLLEEIGYGLDLTKDINGDAIQAAKLYGYKPDQGFYQAYPKQMPNFSGKSLLALAEENLTENDLSELKILMRLAIKHVLHGATLRSAEIFN